MKRRNLLNTLLEVASLRSGRPIDDIYDAVSRPFDDPALWRRDKRFRELEKHEVLSDRDIDVQRRTYHRISTRKSRLITRLCEEIALSGAKDSDMVRFVDREIAYYQQLLTAQLLDQDGHTAQALELARRVLQRATGANETTMALLAGDLIHRLGGYGHEPSRQLTFIAQQRTWTDVDHVRRRAELIANEYLVAKRHRTDTRYTDDLQATEELLGSLRDDDNVESIDRITHALLVQRMLREGRSHEAWEATSTALSTLQKHYRRITPPWLDVWYLTSHVRSLIAQGMFEDVIDIVSIIEPHWLLQGPLAHELLRNRMLAEMRLGRWSQAIETLATIDQHIDDRTDIIDIERRSVLAMYLLLAHQLVLCPADMPIDSDDILSSISLIDVIAEDRRGLGALVLIYRAIDTFLHGDPDMADRKILNLQVYASRNLRGDGSSALRGFVSFLRMLIIHRVSFIENPRRVRRFTDAFAREYDNVCDQAVCPLDLSTLAGALTAAVLKRRN